MIEITEFYKQVTERVPGYRSFLAAQGVASDLPFEQLPLTTKQNYLLEYPIEELCWDASLQDCHLIGSSSGFSKSGSVFWPKRPQDEAKYLEGLEQMLAVNYGINRKRTLILCCMALGTWFAGVTITSALRVIAASGRLPITVCTPGLNLAEAVEIYSRFHKNFEQSLWITNPSNIGLISALLNKKGVDVPPGSCFFPVVGEYFSESFREAQTIRYRHAPNTPFVIWTGYGSADTGDIGVETAATIRLRKFIHADHELRQQLFNSDDTPMLLEMSPSCLVEILDGQIVVSKDQLVPLLRYNTGDEGGLLHRSELAQNRSLPAEILDGLPETVLFVRGRASNAIIFYGTNLNIQDINQHFLSLPPEMGYSGLFTVRQKIQGEVTLFEFTVFVDGATDPALVEDYHRSLLQYLRGQSLEFEAKYANLTRSIGEDLIKLKLEELTATTGSIKHRYIVD